MDNFAKEFMTHLNGKVSDDELAVILRELEVFSGNYDIQKKETALIEYTPQGNDSSRVTGAIWTCEA